MCIYDSNEKVVLKMISSLVNNSLIKRVFYKPITNVNGVANGYTECLCTPF